MKAFLLAAGLGTRLRPYTDVLPKCLMPIHDKPLLEIWFDLLSHYGVSEVLLNTHHHADQVAAFLDDYRQRKAIKVIAVHEPKLLGSAGTLWHNRDFVTDQKDFIIAYADNLTNINLSKLIDFHGDIRSMGGVFTMGLFRAPDPWLRGIAVLDDQQRIIAFEEKPETPRGNLANAGVYIAGNEIFSSFNGLISGRNQVIDIACDLLPNLMGRMFGVPVEGFLQDIGTPQTYEDAVVQWPHREKQNGF